MIRACLREGGGSRNEIAMFVLDEHNEVREIRHNETQDAEAVPLWAVE